MKKTNRRNKNQAQLIADIKRWTLEINKGKNVDGFTKGIERHRKRLAMLINRDKI